CYPPLAWAAAVPPGEGLQLAHRWQGYCNNEIAVCVASLCLTGREAKCQVRRPMKSFKRLGRLKAADSLLFRGGTEKCDAFYLLWPPLRSWSVPRVLLMPDPGTGADIITDRQSTTTRITTPTTC